VLDVAAMKKLRHEGAARRRPGLVFESRTVDHALERRQEGTPPIAFIGKGVCLIPVRLDQAGERHGGHEGRHGRPPLAWLGLMHVLAAGKAKVNAVGAIGIVENAVGGKAQRPGDIVTTTVGADDRIINTDAEGGWYSPRAALRQYALQTEIHVRPRDATGAIIVALGPRICRHVRHDDKLAERLTSAGKATGSGCGACRRPRIRQEDRFEIRRHEEHRRPDGGSITQRNCSRASSTRRRGRISTSPAPAWARRRPTSTKAGPRAGACGCSTAWWRSITKVSDDPSIMTETSSTPPPPAARTRAPTLLEKSLERGWRVVVQAASRSGWRRSDAHL